MLPFACSSVMGCLDEANYSGPMPQSKHEAAQKLFLFASRSLTMKEMSKYKNA